MEETEADRLKFNTHNVNCRADSDMDSAVSEQPEHFNIMLILGAIVVARAREFWSNRCLCTCAWGAVLKKVGERF